MAMAEEFECEVYEARFGTAIYLPPCDFQGVTYEFCIDTETWGDLEGVWHYYGPADNFVIAENPMPNHSGIIAGWALSAFETEFGIQLLAHQTDRFQQPGQPFECVVLALERDDDPRRGTQGV